MSKRNRKPPSYRQRVGYDQAIVTLTDSVTGYRKDYWLGPYGDGSEPEETPPGGPRIQRTTIVLGADTTATRWSR